MAYEEVRDLDPDEFFRTNDMAMSTYLKVKGHVAQQVDWKSGTCYWIFRASDLLLDEVDTFLAGEALIEPKEYNRVFTQTKREFYDSRPNPETKARAAPTG